MELTTVIVDDDKIFQYLMNVMLKETGISTAPLGYPGGKEFMRWWDEREDISGDILVFLDLNMPLMDGWQVLQKLQEQQAKNIFVVVITSSIDPNDQKRARTYPMVIDFITKPILMEDIANLKNSAALSPYF